MALVGMIGVLFDPSFMSGTSVSTDQHAVNASGSLGLSNWCVLRPQHSKSVRIAAAERSSLTERDECPPDAETISWTKPLSAAMMTRGGFECG